MPQHSPSRSIHKFDDVFFYYFTARFAQGAESAKLTTISFAAEAPAKEKDHTLFFLQTYSLCQFCRLSQSA
jgi:hypothetical protein